MNDNESKSFSCGLTSSTVNFRRLFSKVSFKRSLRDHLQKFHNPDNQEEVEKFYQVECQECFALFKVKLYQIMIKPQMYINTFYIQHRNSLERHSQLFHRTSTPANCPYCEFEVRQGVKSDEIQAHIK
jgi:hypothetical protein